MREIDVTRRSRRARAIVVAAYGWRSPFVLILMGVASVGPTRNGVPIPH